MRFFLFFTLFLTLNPLQAQDERFFRRILSGELIESERPPVFEKTYHFVAQSPLYEIDLNGDKKKEALSYEIKDGEHWINIFSASDGKKIIFQGKMETAGKDASLFKISLRELSSKLKVLILFFYEGNSQYLDFNGTGRVYLITFEKNDLSTLHLSPGPAFFQEKEQRNLGYYQRNYAVEIFDYNKDGVRELTVKHGHISRVMMYLGGGKWKEF